MCKIFHFLLNPFTQIKWNLFQLLQKMSTSIIFLTLAFVNPTPEPVLSCIKLKDDEAPKT